MKKDIYTCPYVKLCGACQTLHLSYTEQLKKKQAFVEKLFKRICKVNPIIGMENPTHYRNKIHATFGFGPKKSIVSGLYQTSTHKLVSVENCLLEHESAEPILCTIRQLMKKYRLTPYNDISHTGFLRHVLIRCGVYTNQIMLVLVTGSPIFPSRSQFLKDLRQAHPEITTIIQNINPRHTSMILGQEQKVLFGKGFIEDDLCGYRFRISPHSFYQVNTVQTEKLYQIAIEMAQLTGKERLIDAYCGTGTIGIIASKHTSSTLGIELNPVAVKDAIINAKRNHCNNIHFVTADAGKFMVEMANSGESVDVVILDPPRAGSDEAFLSSLCTLAPKKVVYISCNPKTQKRDVEYLIAKGYILKQVQPVDLFPHTDSIETVVLLSHKTPDSYIHIDVDFGEGAGKIPTDKIIERANLHKPKERITYKMIQEYIEEKYGFKVHTSYIAEVKRSLGLPMHDAPNSVEQLKNPQKHPTPEKVTAIKDALKHFEFI